MPVAANAPSFRRSRLHLVSPAEVAAEYDRACRSPREHDKAKWGSDAGMRNRFALALSSVDWGGVRRWLDVGCGTGAFFAAAEDAGHRFDDAVGVDLSAAMIAIAGRVPLKSPVRLHATDVASLPSPETDFDLVTAIGVLQQCGMTPPRFLRGLADRVTDGGQVFITTKHLGWDAFTDGTLEPESGHSWFDAEELTAACEATGWSVTRIGGFLPREGRVVELGESHTMFVVGKRKWRREHA